MNEEKHTVQNAEATDLEATPQGADEATPSPDAMDESDRDASLRLSELEKQLKDERDRLLRTAADLDNTRKRAKRDVEDAVVRGRQEVLREILPVVDSVDLALGSADPEGPAKPVLEGVEMVRRQFLSATERFGLKPIESVGKAFDPNVHEAVSQLESHEHPAGQIIHEMRRGYLLGDRLLRAAMVIVSAGPGQSDAARDASGPKGDTNTETGDSSGVEGPNE